MNTNQKQKSNWFYLLLLIIVIIFIVIIIFNKDKERKSLEEILEQYKKRIDTIHQTISNKTKQFEIAYKALKLIFIVCFIGICWLTVHFTKSNDFFDYLGNCTKVFSGFGILTLLLCLLNDSDPLSIFHLRTFLKNKLKNYYFDPIQEEIKSLSELETKKEETQKKLSALNEEES